MRLHSSTSTTLISLHCIHHVGMSFTCTINTLLVMCVCCTKINIPETIWVNYQYDDLMHFCPEQVLIIFLRLSFLFTSSQQSWTFIHVHSLSTTSHIPNYHPNVTDIITALDPLDPNVERKCAVPLHLTVLETNY